MNSFLPTDAKSRGRLGLLFALLVLCGIVAATLWANWIHAEQELRTADTSKLQEILKNDPGNTKAQLLLGTKLEAKQDLAGAREAYKRAAELDGDSESAWLGWARVSQKTGEIQEAYSVLEVFMKSHPTNVNALLELAAFYQDQDAVIRAYDSAKKATQIAPKNVRAWRRVATTAVDLTLYTEAESAIGHALALIPDDWRSYYVLGKAQIGLHKEKDALGSFEKASQLAPDEVSPLREIGALQFATAVSDEDFKKALNTLKQVNKSAPEDAGVTLMIGKALLRLNDKVGAEKKFNETIRLAPNEASAYFELSRLAQASGDSKMASTLKARHDDLEAYRMEKGNLLSLIYQDRDDVSKSNERRLKLARLYAKHNDYELSIREYKHLQARVPGDAKIAKELQDVERLATTAFPENLSVSEVNLLAKGDEFRSKGKFRDAGRIYAQVLVKNKKSAPAYLGLGLSLLGNGDKDNAFRAFNKALEIDPNQDAAQFEVARLYREMDFADEAIRRLDLLLKKDPVNAQYHNERGLAYQKVEVFGPAEESFLKAVTVDPGNNDFLINLAFAQAKNNKFAEAERNYRAALLKEPENGVLLAFFGSFLVERSQATGNSAMLKEAEDILKKSLALSPNNFTASFGLGNLYLNRGDAAVALPYLMAANRQNPEINVVYYRLAVAYTKIGDKDKAKLYRKESERRTEYFNRRSNTEQLTRESPKDPALRIKLARIYAEGGDLTRAINQYQVYLTMKPEDATARKERDALVKKADSSNIDIPRSEGS